MKKLRNITSDLYNAGEKAPTELTGRCSLWRGADTAILCAHSKTAGWAGETGDVDVAGTLPHKVIGLFVYITPWVEIGWNTWGFSVVTPTRLVRCWTDVPAGGGDVDEEAGDIRPATDAPIWGWSTADLKKIYTYYIIKIMLHFCLQLTCRQKLHCGSWM